MANKERRAAATEPSPRRPISVSLCGFAGTPAANDSALEGLHVPARRSDVRAKPECCQMVASEHRRRLPHMLNWQLETPALLSAGRSGPRPRRGTPGWEAQGSLLLVGSLCRLIETFPVLLGSDSGLCFHHSKRVGGGGGYRGRWELLTACKTYLFNSKPQLPLC